jgi:hypothetical protein
VRQIKEAVLTFFEVVVYGALLLLRPSVVAGLIFDWILTEMLVQVMLMAVAGTAVLTAIAIHERWYFEHSSAWRLTGHRVEPSLKGEPPPAAPRRAQWRSALRLTVAIAKNTTVDLELAQLRALGRSGRAAALRAMRRRAIDARPAANRQRPWENARSVATLDADAQAQALQVLDLRSRGA